MSFPTRCRVGLLVALLLAGAPAAALQPAVGAVRGSATDTSGGVLPGVTVTATTPDGRLLATAITGPAGQFALEGLPASLVTLTFELSGFETATVILNVPPDSTAWVHERLLLAPLTESVVVYGVAPVHPPPPPPPAPRPRPAPPTIVPVPAEQLESVCGPARPEVRAATVAIISSHRHDDRRTIFTTGDELTLDRGTRDGLLAGTNLVVRRDYRAAGAAGAIEIAEHTAGLVQIVAARDRSSTAVVVYACGEVMQGDRLAVFHPEVQRTPDPPGVPRYDDAARVLFADAGQLLGVERRLMVIDRGRRHGFRPAQRLTLFRRRTPAAVPFVIGDAVVVFVENDSATIRVLRAIDAVWSGDWAAPQRAAEMTTASVARPR